MADHAPDLILGADPVQGTARLLQIQARGKGNSVTDKRLSPDEIQVKRRRALIEKLKAGEIEDLRLFGMLRLGPAKIKYSPAFAYKAKGASLKRYEDILDRVPRQTLSIIKKAWRVWGPGVLVILAERKGQIKAIAKIQPEDESGDVDGNR